MSNGYACGYDPGTCFVQCIRDIDAESTSSTEVRNCYREVDYDPEFEEQLKVNGVHYLNDPVAKKIYVLGKDAFMQAGMAEFGAGIKSQNDVDILKRPMKDGIINNSEGSKTSLLIMREITRICIENNIGKARDGEIVYYSIPANPVDSSINNTYHQAIIGRHLESLGFQAFPIGEAMACLFAENPKMHTPEGLLPFTGLALSCGAGQMNFCLAERGIPLDEFSVARSGDYIDKNASLMTGIPKTKIIRIKERDLNFDQLDESNEVLLALDCYYNDVIQHVFGHFAKRFSKNKGSIDYPVDLVICGGTACPKGFDRKVKKILSKMDLPFEIAEVRLAGGGDKRKMLEAVARGCWLRSKRAANKAANAKDVLEDI